MYLFIRVYHCVEQNFYDVNFELFGYASHMLRASLNLTSEGLVARKIKKKRRKIKFIDAALCTLNWTLATWKADRL